MKNIKKSTLNDEKVDNFTHFLETPLKSVACWEWFPKSCNEFQIIFNNTYLSVVLFVLLNLLVSLIVNLYTEWRDVMSSLDKMADGLPIVASVLIVAYFAAFKEDLYNLIMFMNDNFKWRSARGLTNMTMVRSYKAAKNFAYLYTVSTLLSVAMYVLLPVAAHLWTKQPLQPWIYNGVTSTPFIVLIFLRQCLGQGFVALAVGQLGVYFACNSILLCGQLDLLCCCLRNVRYTAMLRRGVEHAAVARYCSDIVMDEKHNYLYNISEMLDTSYHYDEKINEKLGTITEYDIYSAEYDEATSDALRECARVLQIVNEFKKRFEAFVSPLLVLRVVQVTLYLCTLLYAATLKFDMITVEYLVAVAVDIYVYCYFGNQIILQAERVSSAAYQCAWPSMGASPRRLLLNILLANVRPVLVRAGRFLPMNLTTFVVILKTSFSYYTLLVNMNEEK